MNRVAAIIDSLTSFAGRSVSWLTTFLVLLICTDVLLRYAFSTSRAWVIELEWHLFAVIFLLGAAYTLREDEHVRVDLFYSRWSDTRKAWVNLIGTVFLLIPWCLIIISTGYRYAHNALVIHESSPDPGGLPARYVIKFAIVAGFVLLLLQAIAMSIRSVQDIQKKSQ